MELLESTATKAAVSELQAGVKLAARRLVDVLRKDDASDADTIRAASAVLDRAGIGPHSFPHSDPNGSMTDEEIDRALDEYIAEHAKSDS
jgi:hypothetical protein